MADTETKVPVGTENKTVKPQARLQAWHPFESLRREVDRLFDEFDGGAWPSPFRRSNFEALWRLGPAWPGAPATDITNTDKAYEITAELPGMDEKDIEVKVASGVMSIKGQKKEATEEKNKDYYLQERRFGSFERSFRLPEGVDSDKIVASSKKGVLTVTLPKTPEAQKAEKRIEVRAA